jgi:tetratricopeptide (TPR) repeat protein
VQKPPGGGLRYVLQTLIGSLIIMLAGCASAPQTEQLLQKSTGLPSHSELTQAPFFPQERFQCGPAALATVLKYSGVNIDAGALVDEIYLPSRLGSLQIEILASSRRHGRLPYRISPDLFSLLSEVAAGNPVLVLQNLGLSWAPQWHYAVVVGFNLPQREIILRSGLEARHRTSLDTFEYTWARGRYWGIVVLPVDTLPATANADAYLRSVISLEGTQQKERWQLANKAYQTALTRWPNNLVAQMGLGNSAYQLADLKAATDAFRAAVRDHPNAAAAHNNLAQVLMELALLKQPSMKQESLDEAEKHAQRAVALGGPHLESYRATLAEIQQAQKMIR